MLFSIVVGFIVQLAIRTWWISGLAVLISYGIWTQGGGPQRQQAIQSYEGQVANVEQKGSPFVMSDIRAEGPQIRARLTNLSSAPIGLVRFDCDYRVGDAWHKAYSHASPDVVEAGATRAIAAQVDFHGEAPRDLGCTWTYEADRAAILKAKGAEAYDPLAWLSGRFLSRVSPEGPVAVVAEITNTGSAAVGPYTVSCVFDTGAREPETVRNVPRANGSIFDKEDLTLNRGAVRSVDREIRVTARQYVAPGGSVSFSHVFPFAAPPRAEPVCRIVDASLAPDASAMNPSLKIGR